LSEAIADDPVDFREDDVENAFDRSASIGPMKIL
jgi:hypothetical protein